MQATQVKTRESCHMLKVLLLPLKWAPTKFLEDLNFNFQNFCNGKQCIRSENSPAKYRLDNKGPTDLRKPDPQQDLWISAWSGVRNRNIDDIERPARAEEGQYHNPRKALSILQPLKGAYVTYTVRPKFEMCALFWALSQLW